MAAQKYQAFTFTVSGEGRVPIDMMRYDWCVPFTSEDASKAAIPITVPSFVMMIGFAAVGCKTEPTYDRWRSFGWEVDRSSVKVVKAA